MRMSPPVSPVLGAPLSVTWARNLTQFVQSLVPISGPGIIAERKPNGTVFKRSENGGSYTPVYASSSGAHPFKVRWQRDSQEDKDSGHWQIYLPFGCATLGSDVYLPSKDMKLGVDRDKESIADWYEIPDPSEADAFVTDVGKYKALSWTVKVFFKPWPRMHVSTDPDGGSEGHGHYEVAVATIHLIERDGKKSRRVSQLVGDAQKVERDAADRRFAIVYDFGVNLYKRDAKFKVKVTNQSVMLGRLQAEIKDDTDITEWRNVYLHITHSSTDFKISLKQEKEDTDNVNTYILLYELEDGIVKKDYRDSIDEIPFYNE